MSQMSIVITYIDLIIHMATKGHLILDMFDMMKYDPNRLEVTTRLHLLHQFNSIPLSINRHFEEKNLLSKLLS
jgi:hypothetical protein